MNHLIFRILLSIFLFSLASCVVILPKKKYDALINEKNTLSKNLQAANTSIDSLLRVVKLHRDTIVMLRKDTAILNARLNSTVRQLNTLSDNYQQLRSNSATEIKSLLKTLEDTKADLTKREQRLQEVEDILNKRDDNINALKEKLSNALLGFKNSGLSVTIKDGKVYVSLTDKLLFNTGSIEIDERGKEALQELANVLRTQPEINILVEGHTDNVKVTNLGQIKDNWDLSALRSTAVVRFLTDVQKLDPLRVTASGKGEYLPVDKLNTAEAKSRNRRIEIILTPKLDELYQLLGS